MHRTTGRRQEPVQLHQVLILIALSLFGGSDDQSLGDRVRDTVSEKDRREIAGTIADEIDAELDRHGKRLVETRTSVFGVARDHGATAVQLRGVLSRSADAAENTQATILDARFRLRDRMSPDEWAELCEGLDPEE
ncbi:MAG: hypothetical protein ACYTG2_06135 [Planctomycetota bacterium]